jgi:hypothetical protein
MAFLGRLETDAEDGHRKVYGASAFGVAGEAVVPAVRGVAEAGLVLLWPVDGAGTVKLPVLAVFEALQVYAERLGDGRQGKGAQTVVLVHSNPPCELGSGRGRKWSFL